MTEYLVKLSADRVYVVHRVSHFGDMAFGECGEMQGLTQRSPKLGLVRHGPDSTKLSGQQVHR